MTSETA